MLWSPRRFSQLNNSSAVNAKGKSGNTGSGSLPDNSSGKASGQNTTTTRLPDYAIAAVDAWKNAEAAFAKEAEKAGGDKPE